MKKVKICVIVAMLFLCAALGFAACDGDGEPNQITVDVSQSGDTDGITEFAVKAAYGNYTDDLTLGDNTVTYATTPYIAVTFKLADDYFLHALKIGGESVSVFWKDGEAKYSFVLEDSTSVELIVYSNRRKIKVVLKNNTDGLANIDVMYNGIIKNSDFDALSGETFDIRRLSTDYGEDYRFVTTLDCHDNLMDGYKSTNDGRPAEWFTVSLYEDDEGADVVVKVDVEYFVRVDLVALPKAVVPNVKVIQILASDLPAGVLLPKDMLKYGTVVFENTDESVTLLSGYFAKGAMLAVVAVDGQGDLRFFPNMLVDGTSSNGLVVVDSAKNVEIGSL